MMATTRPHRAAISWSAGKDSCLALVRARAEGLPVDLFLTMLEPDGLSKSHALPSELIDTQARALNAHWRGAKAGPGQYAEVFDAQLQRLHDEGYTHLVFGDIDLQAHRDWAEQRCAQAGLTAVYPLWAQPRASLAQAILDEGIRARVVCVDTRWLDASFCGVDYDAAFLARLPQGVCPCGEDGEFHTFVFDGPGFAQAVPLTPAPLRRVPSTPPMLPTDLIFQPLS
jgi:diphthine-ammonia ligase